ncbi:GIY-YIG nuclease family protein [Flavobacterium azooxidireducens]|uniref:GIY-YIG nuclease family protein n=1 Tax=Flavobacterium azooxidireducens TaxID=1871076 RepID=A0ABY4KHH5_9FLAO|nr:GIY-YIG nuclease family protein [Flavobacterium azooxidireducens]UPQ80262.1 GIY-YIG nuclease family protein [Flavobacterium azooxidireducens]
MHIVYILHSQKLNRFYIGYTTNLDLRLDFHLHDTQARKFTYKADDWTLFFSLACTSKNQALAIEKHIKAMKSKVYIENLAIYPEITSKLLNKYATSDC